MSEEQMIPASQVKAIAVAIASQALKGVVKNIIVRWWQIGFLCGLTVGWIAGGMVMIWLQ